MTAALTVFSDESARGHSFTLGYPRHFVPFGYVTALIATNGQKDNSANDSGY